MLDYKFYRDFYLGGGEYTDSEILSHWEELGKMEGFFENPNQALSTLLLGSNIPKNFDVLTYLDINRDVAKSVRWPFEAVLHYLNYGLSEGRQYRYNLIAPSPVDSLVESAMDPVLSVDLLGLGSPSYRLLTNDERERWIEVGLDKFGEHSVRAFLESHPRRLATNAGFNLSSYMANNPDIAEATAGNPLLSALHFLEFGLEEGRNAKPERLDTNFIWAYYSVKVGESDSLEFVLKKIREKSIEFNELYFLNELEWADFHKIESLYFLPYFDHEYYRCFMPEEYSLEADRWTCLKHFWSIGRFVPADISYEMKFDVDHYRSSREDVTTSHVNSRPRPVVELFNEWLIEGLRCNDSPNMQAWLFSRLNMAPPDNFDALLSEYGQLVGLELHSQVKLAEHLLNSGDKAILALSGYDLPVGLLLTKIADRHAMSGNEQLADSIYQHVVSDYPELTSALQHQSDQLDRAGFIGSASALREMAIHREAKSAWSYITLSNGYEALGNFDRAAKVLRQGCSVFPGDSYLRQRRQLRARQAFDNLWNSAPSLALRRGYTETQTKITAALQEYAGGRSTQVVRSGEIKRVAIVANYDIAQCKLYRVDQKVFHLEEAGFCVKAYNYSSEIDDFSSAAGTFDAVIFFRVPAFPKVIDAISLANDLGLATYYDIDDLIFDADHFPPPLATYAGSISAGVHAEISCGVPMFAFAMSLCTYGIVSTDALVPLVANYVSSGIVYVHRNALGLEHAEAVNRRSNKPRTDGKFRIFYGSGTKAHKEDFYSLLEPALVKIVEEHGDRVEIYLLGYFEWTESLLSISSNVTMMQPVWDVDLYWSILSEMDVNLAVLSPSLTNDCKSEIKWLEAAMFGIPSVVSKTQTFSDVVRDGETGFLCGSTDEFYQALTLLVKDSRLQSTIGDAARDIVRKAYGSIELSRNLAQILNSAQAPKKARLLFVNVFYPPQAIGGATRVVHNNVQDLLERYGDEFEIDVVCTLEGGTEPFAVTNYSLEGVRVFAITAPSLPDIDKVALNRDMADAFASCIDVIKPDLIHFHCIQRLTAATANLAYERKIPYVITVHDGWWISDYQFLVDGTDIPQLYQYRSTEEILRNGGAEESERAVQLRKPLFNARHVLSISDAFTKIYQMVGVPNVITVENGLPPLQRIAKTRSKRGKVRLAHVGGVERHKGFHLVKYALTSSNFTNLELMVVDATLEAGATRSETWGGTVVRYRGRSRQDKVSEMYSEIDVLLAPSVWPEGFGLVTREALACGCWVIASDRGAVGTDVVPGVNGYVIDVATIGPLKAVLEKMNADPDIYMRSPDYQTVLRHSTEQADELAELYRRILGGRMGD